MSGWVPGRFSWYETMTTDVEGAKAFYGAITGWGTAPFGDGGYTMWTSSQGPVGGVMELPASAREMGAPPMWIGTIVVTDLDAALAKVTARGGKIYNGPETVPDVGRFATIADPHGAVVTLIVPTGDMAAHDRSKPGEIGWHELTTKDLDAAVAFYADVCGLEKVGEHDMGQMGIYALFGSGTEQHGGMFVRADAPSSWLYYINVASIEGAIAEAQRLGAKLALGPVVVPGGARIAQLTDPQGAWFALMEGPSA